MLFLSEIRHRAGVGCFLDDPALGAAWAGLFKSHPGSIGREGSVEILERSGIVLRLPDHRTIRFRLVAPSHRVPQKAAQSRNYWSLLVADCRSSAALHLPPKGDSVPTIILLARRPGGMRCAETFLFTLKRTSQCRIAIHSWWPYKECTAGGFDGALGKRTLSVHRFQTRQSLCRRKET